MHSELIADGTIAFYKHYDDDTLDTHASARGQLIFMSKPCFDLRDNDVHTDLYNMMNQFINTKFYNLNIHER